MMMMLGYLLRDTKGIFGRIKSGTPKETYPNLERSPSLQNMVRIEKVNLEALVITVVKLVIIDRNVP